MRTCAEPDSFKHVLRAAIGLGTVATLEPKGYSHVLQQGEVWQHVKGLKHEAKTIAPQLRQGVVTEPGEFGVADADTAAADRLKASEAVEQGRLANAGFADDRHAFASPNLHAEQLKEFAWRRRCKRFAELSDFEHGFETVVDAESARRASSLILRPRHPRQVPCFLPAPMPVDHYENFPVASFLLPARLREPVEAIYAFARSADDIADEGDATAVMRLARLNDYRNALNAMARGEAIRDAKLAPMFERLGRAVREFALPIQLLRDLLDAFSQDVGKTRYADFPELLDYCRRSANPVGRLLLHLYDRTEGDNFHLSDCICSSLQLINFWQDVAVDWRKARIYIPQDDLARFGVDAGDIEAARCDERWRALLAFEVKRARAMMLEGAPLARRLHGRAGWELRLVVAGGLRILDCIESSGYDVFRHRPVLGKTDWVRIAWRALFHEKN